jgi:hypothetical protein
METTLDTTAAPARPHRALFWTVTGLLAAGMAFGGLAQLLGASWNAEGMRHLGYPLYVMKIVGSWKMAGVVALLVPGRPLVKEWAYAGFFCLLTSAWVSHLASGDAFLRALPPLVFAGLTAASWYLRPADRRVREAAPGDLAVGEAR